MKPLPPFPVPTLVLLPLALFFAVSAFAHCDTLDGPVVTDARAALDAGDPSPVLKWVPAASEKEIRDAFARTLTVREQSPESRELADMYFFETLVRIHRAGEGVPYTGIKPAGSAIEEGISEADHALESGSVEELARAIGEAAAEGIRERFRHALEAKAHAAHNVEAGRRYVAAYVEFIHYVERLHADATSPAHHAEAGSGHEHH